MGPADVVERFEVSRIIQVPTEAVFAVVTDPRGHVAIESAGMLMFADGKAVTAIGDTVVVRMDREALNGYSMGCDDVTVIITRREPRRLIEWAISGTVQPPLEDRCGCRLGPTEGNTLATPYYDRSKIDETYRRLGLFPVLPEPALRAARGIFARTVAAAASVFRGRLTPW